MDARCINEFGDVPPVDPECLHSAVMIVYDWADDGIDEDEEPDPDVINGEDLHDLLNRMRRTFEVDRPATIALFKRAIALSTFCSEVELHQSLFEDGLPGRELCTAAAQVPVLNRLGDEDNEMGHTFDERAIFAALSATGN